MEEQECSEHQMSMRIIALLLSLADRAERAACRSAADDEVEPEAGASSPMVEVAVLALAVDVTSIFTPGSSSDAVLGTCG